MIVTIPKITLVSRVQPSPQALIQPTGDEAIVLDIASERYFVLNAVGARLWALLLVDPDLAHAHSQLLEEYDVEADDLERDLVAIVVQLSDAGLARVLT